MFVWKSSTTAIHYVAGSDRFGPLSAASLKVSARLKAAQWNISTQEIESPDGLLLAGNAKAVADTMEHSPQVPLAGVSVHVYCLEIQDAKYWARHFKTEWGPAFTGLLLFECPDAQSTYRRVSLFSLAKVNKAESRCGVLDSAIKNLAWFESSRRSLRSSEVNSRTCRCCR